MMRVFVLCTGRCGSLTFAKACQQMSNFTAGHESGAGLYTLVYPEQHIEVDNRLAWMLGPLALKYPNAIYVWLRRQRADVIESFTRRFVDSGIMHGFCRIVQRGPAQKLAREMYPILAEQYVDTVEANIATFLQDRIYFEIYIEEPFNQFIRFWVTIGAEGDLAQAKKILRERYNAG